MNEELYINCTGNGIEIKTSSGYVFTEEEKEKYLRSFDSFDSDDEE